MYQAPTSTASAASAASTTSFPSQAPLETKKAVTRLNSIAFKLYTLHLTPAVRCPLTNLPPQKKAVTRLKLFCFGLPATCCSFTQTKSIFDLSLIVVLIDVNCLLINLLTISSSSSEFPTY